MEGGGVVMQEGAGLTPEGQSMFFVKHIIKSKNKPLQFGLSSSFFNKSTCVKKCVFRYQKLLCDIKNLIFTVNQLLFVYKIFSRVSREPRRRNISCHELVFVVWLL